MKKCSISDCNNKSKTAKYCGKHYSRLIRNGDPLVLKNKNTETIRYCSQCQEPKELNNQNFTKDKTCKYGFKHSCRECNIKKVYPQHKFAIYGLTIDGYNNLFKEQNYACSICKKTDVKLQVDHNHNIEGKEESRRGLLCHYCNSMLAMARDNVDYLIAGLHYLNKWNKKYV